MQAPVCVVSRKNKMDLPLEQGLYDPANEHDACGVGFIAHIKGQPNSLDRQARSRRSSKIWITVAPLALIRCMGDGAGILIQIPDTLFREEMAKQNVTLPPAGDYGVGMVFLPKEHGFPSGLSGRDRTCCHSCRRAGRPRLARCAHRSDHAHVADCHAPRSR
jgi:hypothetical protein